MGWINILSLSRKYVHFKRIIKEFLLNKNTNNLKQKLNLKKNCNLNHTKNITKKRTKERTLSEAMKLVQSWKNSHLIGIVD